MKINSDFEPQAGQGVSGAGAAGGAESVQTQRAGAHTSQSATIDKADLSSEAQQFATLSAQASKVPDVRADRVASLKNAVQNGTYNVSNQQIAQAMQRDFNPGS
ncbi:MAG TPA: flagellar biosynthesis anti-sigma factor FlgM [Candidatus Acidoferrales bacterium]